MPEREHGPADAPDVSAVDDDTPGAVLRTLLVEAIGDDLAALDGDVTIIDRGDGQGDDRGGNRGPADRIQSLVAASESVVGVIPRIDVSLACRLFSVGGDRDNEGDRDVGRITGDVRLVFTDHAARRVAGVSGAAIRAVLSEHGVEPYLHDGRSPVGVLIGDGRAIVGLFDDDGLAAVLWSDARAVREWAAETCRRYLAAAEPA